jgi:hypothetical protein
VRGCGCGRAGAGCVRGNAPACWSVGRVAWGAGAQVRPCGGAGRRERPLGRTISACVERYFPGAGGRGSGRHLQALVYVAPLVGGAGQAVRQHCLRRGGGGGGGRRVVGGTRRAARRPAPARAQHSPR